jgi:hypothetical protein
LKTSSYIFRDGHKTNKEIFLKWLRSKIFIPDPDLIHHVIPDPTPNPTLKPLLRIWIRIILHFGSRIRFLPITSWEGPILEKRVSRGSDPDPHQSERHDPDPHQSKKPDPDPHQCDADPQHCLAQCKIKSLIIVHQTTAARLLKVFQALIRIPIRPV